MKRSLLSLLQSTKLLIIFYAGGIVVFPYLAWNLLIIGIISMRWELLLMMGGIALLCLGAGLAWLAILNLIYSLMLRILWSNPPRWSRIMSSKGDLLKSYLIGAIACIPLSLIFATSIGFKVAIESWTDTELAWNRENAIALEILLNHWWIWLLGASLLFTKTRLTGATAQPE